MVSRKIVASNAHVDLQLHTIHSDGQWVPAELFRYLAERHFAVAAVTDHDSLEYSADICVLGEEAGVHVIPGTEITTAWRGLPAHLLCYSSGFTGDILCSLATRIRDAQLNNTRDVFDVLIGRGYRFPRAQDVLAHQNGHVLRPVDNAQLLVAHGYTGTIEQALDVIREAGYRQTTVPLADAIEAAHASGAVAVLAHPGRGGGELHAFSVDELNELVTLLPLDGIEAYYPTHTAEQVKIYSAFASARGLLVSAGSDSHGSTQRYPIAYPASLVAPLLERCGVAVTL